MLAAGEGMPAVGLVVSLRVAGDLVARFVPRVARDFRQAVGAVVVSGALRQQIHRVVLAIKALDRAKLAEVVVLQSDSLRRHVVARVPKEPVHAELKYLGGAAEGVQSFSDVPFLLPEQLEFSDRQFCELPKCPRTSCDEQQRLNRARPPAEWTNQSRQWQHTGEFAKRQRPRFAARLETLSRDPDQSLGYKCKGLRARNPEPLAKSGVDERENCLPYVRRSPDHASANLATAGGYWAPSR